MSIFGKFCHILPIFCYVHWYLIFFLTPFNDNWWKMDLDILIQFPAIHYMFLYPDWNVLVPKGPLNNIQVSDTPSHHVRSLCFVSLPSLACMAWYYVVIYTVLCPDLQLLFVCFPELLLVAIIHIHKRSIDNIINKPFSL